MRFGYKNQLDSLRNKVINMIEKISFVLSKTIDIFANIDTQEAKKILEYDVNIDKFGRTIEDICLKIFSLQNPYASDLRAITGYLKVVSDFERIGDHCSDICEIVSMGNLESPKFDCYQKTISILAKVGDSFNKISKACIELDIDTAKKIFLLDDEIDDTFSEIIMNISDNISNKVFSAYMGADLMFIAKYAERIGDHCVNISKWIVYMSLGFFPKLKFFRKQD